MANWSSTPIVKVSKRVRRHLLWVNRGEVGCVESGDELDLVGVAGNLAEMVMSINGSFSATSDGRSPWRTSKNDHCGMVVLEGERNHVFELV